MTTYFTSKAPSKSAAKRSSVVSLAESKFDIGDEDPWIQLQRLPPKNEAAKAALLARLEREFPKWLLFLREGFSLLFHGFGSKKALLERFANEQLLDGGVVVFNGFVPNLTMRDILSKVATMLKKPRGGDSHAILEQICEAPAEGRLYVLIHNIDGPGITFSPLSLVDNLLRLVQSIGELFYVEGLRSRETQQALSELSRCPAIRFLASVDHVNAALLWDKRTADRFNWLHFDATTYAPYAAETREIPSLLLGRREVVRRLHAATVLRTLVPQARVIFRLLAENQMAEQHDDDGGDKGMTFAQLFRMSRERLLVANDTALRSHLTEFKDHDLLQTRRGLDGSDVLIIPVDDSTLQQILDDMDRHQ